MPATHAASGGDGASQLPTQAPSLPEKPNVVPNQLKTVLSSDFDADVAKGRARKSQYGVYGPYYEELSGDYSFRTIFPPLWMERRQKVKGGVDRSSLYGFSYFQRRSPKVDADIFFPLFWKMRHGKTFTTVVGPVMHREGPRGHDNWLAPIYFEGKHDDTSYFHIPPLLTFNHRTSRSGFSMVGPLFCKWEGGGRCDGRTATKLDMGIAPLYFYGRDARSEYEIIPPLLHYYRYDERGDSALNVWGPLWMEKSREGGVFNVLPLFWHSWAPNEQHTTLFPLFHYGYKGAERTIATPLFVDHVAEDGAHTFATYVYARHRGRTELDMYTPLFWQYRDPDIDLERTVAFPFYYRNTSPRSDDLVLFPFYGHFKRHGISSTHWITPLFRHETSITGWQTSVFPVFHMGRQHQSTHLVVAPVIWDFASPKSRSTVVFPFYWRFSDRKSVSQLVGNTYYSEEKVKGGTEWQFHFFPLFSYGESPQGHWWNILYGLAGYTQEGTMAKMRIGYVPIKLSDKER